jgi:ATP-dependent helicase YprA (DUF1998 family)
MSSDEQNPSWKFHSEAGYALCRQIILKNLSFGPHDYQLEGITKVLDGENLIAIIKTSGGKSAYIYMVLLIITAIQQEPALCPSASFPLDPAILLILPTTALQDDQVSAHIESIGDCD